MIDLLISVPKIFSSVPITIVTCMTNNLVSNTQCAVTQSRYLQQEHTSFMEQTDRHDWDQSAMNERDNDVSRFHPMSRDGQSFGSQNQPINQRRSSVCWNADQAIRLEQVFGSYIYESEHVGGRTSGLQLVKTIATSPPIKHHVISNCSPHHTSHSTENIAFLAVKSMIGNKPIILQSIRQSQNSNSLGEQHARTRAKWMMANELQYMGVRRQVSELNMRLDQIDKMNLCLRNACRKFKEEINEVKKECEKVHEMMEEESYKLYNAVQQNNILLDTISHLNNNDLLSRNTPGRVAVSSHVEIGSFLIGKVNNSEIVPNQNARNMASSSNVYPYRPEAQTNVGQSCSDVHQRSTTTESLRLYGEGLSLQQEQDLDL